LHKRKWNNTTTSMSKTVIWSLGFKEITHGMLMNLIILMKKNGIQRQRIQRTIKFYLHLSKWIKNKNKTHKHWVKINTIINGKPTQ
jgi:hypothetical protein